MDILASALTRGIITFLFVAICVLLITVILLQKGRGGGLAGAFGGAGGYSAFGAKTGDVFTWITIVLTAMFVLVSICGVFVFKPDTAPPPPAVAPADSGEPGKGGALPAGAPARAPTNVPINVPPGAPTDAPGATQPAR